jgi:DNA-binding Lrp family transcriptional regulator
MAEWGRYGWGHYRRKAADKDPYNQFLDRRAREVAEGLPSPKKEAILSQVGKDWIGLFRGMLAKYGVPNYAVDDAVQDYLTNILSGEDDPFIEYGRSDNPNFGAFWGQHARYRVLKLRARIAREQEREQTNLAYEEGGGTPLEEAGETGTGMRRTVEQRLPEQTLDNRILRTLEKSPRLTLGSLARRLRADPAAVAEAMRRLYEKGDVKEAQMRDLPAKGPRQETTYADRVARYLQTHPNASRREIVNNVRVEHGGGRRQATAAEMDEAIRAAGVERIGTPRLHTRKPPPEPKAPPEPKPPTVEPTPPQEGVIDT